MYVYTASCTELCCDRLRKVKLCKHILHKDVLIRISFLLVAAKLPEHYHVAFKVITKLIQIFTDGRDFSGHQFQLMIWLVKRFEFLKLFCQ